MSKTSPLIFPGLTPEELIHELPGSIYWKDKDGRYLGCSQYVADLANLESPNDIIGKTDE